MPRRKSVPTCLALPPTCTVIDEGTRTDVAPEGATCPNCQLGADDHESGRLEYPWCMRDGVTADRFARISSQGSWAHQHETHVNGKSEVTWTSMFWRQATASSRGRTFGLPRPKAFIGRSVCAPLGETATINPTTGLVLGDAARLVYGDLTPRQRCAIVSHACAVPVH